MSAEQAMDEGTAQKRKKAKDRVLQLSEHRRGLFYNVVAQYGTSDDPRYVVNVNVDGEVFQGVGPSRKRAKTMAAEQALVRLSVLSAFSVEEKPEPEVYLKDDLTADVFDSCGLMYSFATPDLSGCSSVTPLMAVDTGYEEEAEYDEFECYTGRNSLSILSELRPDATFRLVYESRNASVSKFVMTVKVDGEIFRGEAPSKKLAKARAARDALEVAVGMNFSHSEDGMPIYEGSGHVWQEYKEKLEKESHKLVGSFALKNPVAQLHELFPDITYEFPDIKVELGGFFQCKIKVNEVEYDGIGKNKKDAKANAASNALESLRVSGFLEKRMKELEEKKQAKAKKLKELEKPDTGNAKNRLDKWFKVAAAPPKNAVSKLNELFPACEFVVVGEMPMRNTNMTAFAISVRVNGRTYIGIGKNKKLAKVEAAEKALRGIGMWSEDDDYMKAYALRGDRHVEELWGMGGPQWEGRPPARGNRGGIGFPRGGRGPARGGFGFRGGANIDVFQAGYAAGYQGDETGWGWGEGDDYEGGNGGQQDDSMIYKLSSIVAKLLEANPTMGASDVWNQLQTDDSWQGGLDMGLAGAGPQWQQGGGGGGAAGFGRGRQPASFIGGAPTSGFDAAPGAGRGRGSASAFGRPRGSAAVGRGFGYSRFSDDSFDSSYMLFEQGAGGSGFGSGKSSGRGYGNPQPPVAFPRGRGGYRGAMGAAMGQGRGLNTNW